MSIRTEMENEMKAQTLEEKFDAQIREALHRLDELVYTWTTDGTILEAHTSSGELVGRNTRRALEALASNPKCPTCGQSR